MGITEMALFNLKDQVWLGLVQCFQNKFSLRFLSHSSLKYLFCLFEKAEEERQRKRDEQRKRVIFHIVTTAMNQELHPGLLLGGRSPNTENICGFHRQMGTELDWK